MTSFEQPHWPVAQSGKTSENPKIYPAMSIKADNRVAHKHALRKSCLAVKGMVFCQQVNIEKPVVLKRKVPKECTYRYIHDLC